MVFIKRIWRIYFLGINDLYGMAVLYKTLQTECSIFALKMLEKMKKIMLIPTGIFLLLLISCASKPLKQSDFLLGTWKMEDKEQYEVWEKNKEGNLQGYSYKMQDDRKKRMESLSIKKEDHQIIYEALVPNQNEGQAIPFVLNTELKDLLSFENEQHDFPKKIQYQKISEQEILVKVLGAEGKGFSYKIFKQ